MMRGAIVRGAATWLITQYNYRMGRLFADTSQEVEDKLIEKLRLASPQRKLAIVGQLNAAVREMLLAGLRRQHPNDSLQAMHRRLADALLGSELAQYVKHSPEEVHSMQPEPVTVMLAIAETFETLAINYVIGGSMASAFYGVGRSTLDVDFVADVRPEHILPMISTLRPDFYLDESMMRSAIERRGSFNLIHLSTLFKVDVFIPGTRAFDKLQLTRRIRASISADPDGQAYFLSPEDVVLAKLDWYQLGGRMSDRQWQDLLGVLIAQRGELDMTYMRENAVAMGLSDLLEKAFSESDNT